MHAVASLMPRGRAEARRSPTAFRHGVSHIAFAPSLAPTLSMRQLLCRAEGEGASGEEGQEEERKRGTGLSATLRRKKVQLDEKLTVIGDDDHLAQR